MRRAGGAVFGCAVAAMAVASCSGTPPPPPDAYINSTIGPVPGSSMTCNLGVVTPEVVAGSSDSPIGTCTAPPCGEPTGMNNTTVSCSVIPSGSGFNVQINVTVQGGSVSIEGTLNPNGATTGVSAGISFNGQSWNDSGDCSVTLNSTTKPPILAGRVWGTATCSNMKISLMPNILCQGVIEFKVENCSQGTSS